MPDTTLALVDGVDIMILDALRNLDHKTHMTIAESVATLQRINAKQSYLVHLCHDTDHAELDASMPNGINVSRTHVFRPKQNNCPPVQFLFYAHVLDK